MRTRTRRVGHWLGLILAVGLLAFRPPLLAPAAPAVPASTASPPLAGFLNPDGSLKRDTGFTGALDPTGWRMAYDAQGAPLFKPVERADRLPEPRGDWYALNGGLNGTVLAIQIVGSYVYIGGDFSDAGDNPDADRIAYWDGTAWHALGGGIQDGWVNAIAVQGSRVYVGGWFTDAGGTAVNNIAFWDLFAWNALGPGVNDVVHALEMVGTDLYVGGNFTDPTGNADHIARWDGTAWHALGSGLNDDVRSIAAVGANVYAGGYFLAAGGSANYVARWDGTTWHPLGAGTELDGVVSDIEVVGANVYVGGGFNDADGNSNADGIARWDGSAWHALSETTGDGLGWVGALSMVGPDIYIGGSFVDAGGNADADYIARWDGSAWQSLTGGAGGGLNDAVLAVAVAGPNLYVGGSFTQADDHPEALHVARWDTTPATPGWDDVGGLPVGVADARVRAIAVVGPDLYIGGAFTDVGGNPAADSVARWDGSAWHALGDGANDMVRAIEVVGPDVYIGGAFTDIGGLPNADRIARWDGSAWHALGGGLGDGDVRAIVSVGPDLYVGGSFTDAGNDPNADYVARWDGSAWHALSAAQANVLGAQVNALGVLGSHLYVGGMFEDAGGDPDADFIAMWDGAFWYSLSAGPGGGVNDAVWAIEVVGWDVVVGGAFDIAGNDPDASGVAVWNDWFGFWYPLGTGLGGADSWVYDIEVVGSDVYVGGWFPDVGGNTAASCIARWDGAAWRALGSGLNDPVAAVKVEGDSVYAGGYFLDAAGNANADHLARWGRREPRRILFDEAHDEENTIDWARAQQLNPAHPEWIYFGRLQESLAEEFTWVRNPAAVLTLDLLQSYDALLLASPLAEFSPSERRAIRYYVAGGGGVLVLGNCGNEHPANTFLAGYGLLFDQHCLFAPIPDWVGDFDVVDFAVHDAVTGVDHYAANWAQSLALSRSAIELAWTGDDSWEDTDGSNDYNAGDRTGPFTVAAAVDTSCGRLVAVSDNDFQDDAFEFRANDVLMRALLRWVTGGQECEIVYRIYLPAVFANY